MALPKSLKELCTPSLVYFVISMLGIFIAIIQNLGNTKKYTLGAFSCAVSSTALIFLVKVTYIFFWTWILNLICKDGYTNVSWFLVLFPFVLLFVLLGMLMISK
jgi:hypothetical protein